MAIVLARAENQERPVTEIPFKQWCAEEGMRQQRTAATIAARVASGEYIGLRIRRDNARVFFVRLNGKPPHWRRGPRKGEVRLGEWAAEQAMRDGVKLGTIWMRRTRGWYPQLRARRVSHGLVYVKP